RITADRKVMGTAKEPNRDGQDMQDKRLKQPSNSATQQLFHSLSEIDCASVSIRVHLWPMSFVGAGQAGDNPGFPFPYPAYPVHPCSFGSLSRRSARINTDNKERKLDAL
ncbi:unnamed protein product, partial [marine sediment metagenome]